MTRALSVAALCLLVLASVPAGAQPPSPPPPADPHAGHQGTDAQAGTPPTASEPAPLPPFIPPVTEADRAAAFPDVPGHAVHDDVVNWFVLVDQLEWQSGSGERGVDWDSVGWVGKDRDRLWIRTEGTRLGHDHQYDTHVHALYGRAVARWWDVVAGVRQDLHPEAARTWLAVGVQGLAPQWFDVEATAYVGPGGRLEARLQTEYDLRITNRVLLQPVAEVDVRSQDDPGQDVGAGLGGTEVGLRLRYLIRREVAPYVGVVWHRTFFGTADQARQRGEPVSGTRLVVGLRLWM